MGKFKLALAMIMVCLLATSCENVGLLGQGGIKGSKVKADILAIANTNNIIIAPIVARQAGSSNATGALIVLSIIIDGAVVPGLAGISDSANYTKGSVDSCKNKMTTVGLLIDNWIGALTCSLDKVPSLIQIGDAGI
jgi:small lipoprotein (TIGR04452 family)